MPRQFTLRMQPALVNGLARTDRDVSIPTLANLANLEPSPIGIITPRVPYEFDGGGWKTALGISGYSFPFPQLFIGKGVVLLATDADGVWMVDTTVSPYTYVKLTVMNYSSQSVQWIPSSLGTLWDFIDNYNAWYLVRDGVTVFYAPVEKYFQGSTNYFFDSDFTITTGCNFKGRNIIGGLDASKFWNSAWQDVWNHWIGELKSQAGLSSLNYDLTAEAPGSNCVAWANAGIGNFPRIMFLKEGDTAQTLGVEMPGTSAISSYSPPALELFKSNSLGWIPIPFIGSVMKVKSLRSKLAVYCENGVAWLTPVDSPVHTFGVTILIKVGLYHKGGIAGDEDKHVWLGVDGSLWETTENGINRIGYQHILQGHVNAGNNIMMSYDHIRHTYYISVEISSGTYYGYTLTPHGLFRSNPLGAITSGDILDGEFTVINKSDGGQTASNTIGFHDVDFGDVGTKRLEGIKVMGHWDSETYTLQAIVAVYDSHASTSYTETFTGDEQGFIYVGLAGERFSITIQLVSATSIDPYIQTDIQDVHLIYELTKIYRREISAMQVYGGGQRQ